jgi:hypothetical protein
MVPCSPCSGPDWASCFRIGIVPYQVGATLRPRSLEGAVQAAGFDVVETTAVMHCPRVIAVVVARPLERLRRSWQEAFLRHLHTWERLERWPTRWLTGHYVAVHAVAPRESGVKPCSR